MNTQIDHSQNLRSGRTQEFWNKFHKLWTPRLEQVARLRLCDGNPHLRNDLDDVIQCIWIRIFKALPGCRWTGMQTWMTRIADRTTLNYIRSKKRYRIFQQFPSAAANGDERHPSDNSQYQLQRAVDGESTVRHDELLSKIDGLPPIHQDAIALQVQGYGDREMAAAWDVTPATARKRLSRARELLRTGLSAKQGRRLPGHSNRE
jgi:RNA polymerase sigma factor (sigma-70 family)